LLYIASYQFHPSAIFLFDSGSVSRGAADNFQFNQETEFVPVLGLISSQLNATETKPAEAEKKDSQASSIADNHHSVLLSLLANELSVAPDEIHDFELYVLILFVPLFSVT
jgi:aspartyl aminopeptidase